MKIVFENKNGRVINGDNIEILKMVGNNTIDSCVSDFPYDLSFMDRGWDTIGDFYIWNKKRAEALYRVIKPGGYVAIFGHPKTNHRMKCAFEDSGFKIVEEIDWVYLNGMPKSQDIGKLVDKNGEEFAVNWEGWKTAGLKPAHEPITIFQKPLDKTYINNLRKYGCGCMNIDACRITYKNIGGKGRFPANLILDEFTAQILDEQTGITKSSGGSGNKSRGALGRHLYGKYKNEDPANNSGGLGDTGGGSRMFPIIKYTPKVSPSERRLPNGERNPHITLKPVELIKWLIKLITPVEGVTIDITAGSGTHGVACEKLNRYEGYNLKWINIELMNTKEEPYCDVIKQRIENL